MDILSDMPAEGCQTEKPPSPQGLTSIAPFILSSPSSIADDAPCCGAPAGPPASPHDRAGYRICHFVEGFNSTPTGFVPRIKTTLGLRDHLSTALVRSNIGRNDYALAPGLYAAGNPDENAPVLVTANYKLSFDHLRKELQGINAHILVLDTRGINVWCAAGKKSFGTEELVNRIRMSGLSKVVSHRTIVVPQLGATGVSAVQVKKQSGFNVIWGPLHTRDLRQFISNNMKADPHMRRLTFSMSERLVLIPVEIALAIKPALAVLFAVLLISGFGPGFFSFQSLPERGLPAVFTLLAGMAAGATLTPAFLPRLPGTMFSIKGAAAGMVLSLVSALIFARHTGFSGVTGLVLMSTAISSWLAMNFTGATPFTSPSGVEKEMKASMPVQALAIFFGILFWLWSAF